MDYQDQPLQFCKKGVHGTEIYVVRIDHGMIVVDSGTVGGRMHRVLHPLAEKRRIDRFFANLVQQGFVIQDCPDAPPRESTGIAGRPRTPTARPAGWALHGQSPLRKT